MLSMATVLSQRSQNCSGIRWLLLVCLHFGIFGRAGAEITIKPPFRTLVGGGETSVKITCGGNDTAPYAIYLTKRSEAVVAFLNSAQNNGNPKVTEKYVERGAVAEKVGSGFSVTIPVVSCKDSGIYVCNYTGRNERLRSTPFSIDDGLQKATLTAKPDKKVKNVTEGEPIELKCRQIYGVINPTDPRTRPKQLHWQWDFRQVESKEGYTRISGALSIFKNKMIPTKCKGELHESVMTLYPLHGQHDNALFRCYLVVDLKPVEDKLYGSYLTGDIGALPPEEPLTVTYNYKTTSLVAFIVGAVGFLGSLVFTSLYFVNKRIPIFNKSPQVPQSLIEEEHELDRMEDEMHRQLMTNLNETSEQAGESSVAESSVAESSVLESSTLESSTDNR